MIIVEPGATDEPRLEAALGLVRILRECGIDSIVPSEALPTSISRTVSFEAAVGVGKVDEGCASHIVVLNAHSVTNCALSRLRGFCATQKPNLVAIGRFENIQSKVSAQSKIAFSAGYEPSILDLNDLQPEPLVTGSDYLLFGIQKEGREPKRLVQNITAFLAESALEVASSIEIFGVLSHTPGIRLNLVVPASKRQEISRLMGRQVAVYSYAEMQPEVIARRSDLALFLGKGSPGARAACAATHLIFSGGIVVDATETAALSQSGAPVIRGPVSPVGLITFVKETILAQAAELSREVLVNSWLKGNSVDVLLGSLKIGADIAPNLGNEGQAKEADRKILFIPTNGVGLGHAQRSSLVAYEIKEGRPVSFAAFPACLPMLRAKGISAIPLVSKSALHSEPHANDLLNFVRLRRSLEIGQTLVFDGAYIFDSIVRCIRELDLEAVWIRRGLWQAGQIDKMPLEREREFARVIVPGEAFRELNTAYSYGSNVISVGPIVQIDPVSPEEKAIIRQKLAQRFGRKFNKLVVSMLGGGVAADRSAQIQLLCALAESHEDWLHLMVVWPHASMAPGLTTWRNSHVVRTQNAIRLAQCSDVTVSAAGYNSFHELIYHSVPTVFVPQMAGYMDDQDRRARSAAERGLSIKVDPEDLLRLRREVESLMSTKRYMEMKQKLNDLELPEIGNSAAARIVEGNYGS